MHCEVGIVDLVVTTCPLKTFKHSWCTTEKYGKDVSMTPSLEEVTGRVSGLAKKPIAISIKTQQRKKQIKEGKA